MNTVLLSDFHIGREHPSQETALLLLVEKLLNQADKEDIQVGALFLVGDLVYSGKREEFDKFEEVFLNPLIANSRFSKSKVFAVPGNHDLDCDEVIPSTWESIGERNQSAFLTESEKGIKLRSFRAEAFKEYQNFVSRNNILSPNPFKEVSILHQDDSLPFDVIATNTSFLCDRGHKSNAPIYPCPLDSLRKFTHQRNPEKILIILGHHPEKCFLDTHAYQLETFLGDNRALYLHGHFHDPRIYYNGDGTARTIGFGAAYINEATDAVLAPYKNTFALCRFRDELEISGFSWEGAIGKWEESSSVHFSRGLTEDQILNDRIKVSYPLPTTSPAGAIRNENLSEVPRKTARPRKIIPLSASSTDIWITLISVCENLGSLSSELSKSDFQLTSEDGGKYYFSVKNQGNRHLLVCIPGISHVLSSQELEACNTMLDSEDYVSATIISFGSIGDEAQKLYVRLSAKKPIEVKTNADITKRSDRLLTLSQKRILQKYNESDVAATVLIDDDATRLVIVDAKTDPMTFSIIEANGEALNPNHESVVALRENNPDFTDLQYQGQIDGIQQEFSLQEFSERDYLEAIHNRFNTMRYDALAHIGFRFSELSFDEIYIDANASELADASSNRFDDLIEDHLAAFPMSGTLKAQIKDQFHAIGKDTRKEASATESLYQKYSAILLVGDPGSGKTCFAKRQLLNYCKKGKPGIGSDEHSDDWYSVHLPIYIQLSQVISVKGFEDLGILQSSARLLEKQGYGISGDKLRSLFNEGRLAFFFDGLDEIVAIEKRAFVVQEINNLVEDGLRRGNRFVVTSRQAAVQVVDLLPALHQLELKGLTSGEIRELAKRILSYRLTTTSNEVVVDQGTPEKKTEDLLDQIVSDCETNPGVGRLAQNPLLLTLLVLIYVNSGAPSAKRHRIYSDAVKTLAQVRRQQMGHAPVSEQDLRERLGAIAISVYKKESGFLPTRKEVCEIVAEVMSRKRSDGATIAQADEFIQKVSETTGLITIGGQEGESDENSIVTFMHHSFLEYFAAIGLSKELSKVDLVSLVNQPRWREVLTLLAGIIGESDDVATVLEFFVGDGSEYGAIDGNLLLFAIDCALETDVPSDTSLQLLSDSFSACVTHGPALHDPWVRRELGSRLEHLIFNCGFDAMRSVFEELLGSGEPRVVSATVRILTHSTAANTIDSKILSVVEQLTNHSSEAVQVAICEASAENRNFRTEIILQLVTRSLKKSKRLRRASFEAMAQIPVLAGKYWAEIINGLDDDDIQVKRFAAAAAIQAGINSDRIVLNASRRDTLIKSLQLLGNIAKANDSFSPEIELETVQSLLNCATKKDRLIGISLLSWCREDPKKVYHIINDIINDSDDRDEVVAALNAARTNSGVRTLFVISDLLRVGDRLAEGEANVRRASAMLLGCFSKTPCAVEYLLKADLHHANSTEYSVILHALSNAKVLTDKVEEILVNEFDFFTRKDVKKNSINNAKLDAVLSALSEFGCSLCERRKAIISEIIRDFKHKDHIRRAAILAFPAVSVPSVKVVETLCELLRNPPLNMRLEVCQMIGIFANKTKQGIDFIIASVEAMPLLIEAAKELHQKLFEAPSTDETQYCVTELRDGIDQISRIIETFREFIDDTFERSNETTKG